MTLVSTRLSDRDHASGEPARVRLGMITMSILLTFVILAPLVADGPGGGSGEGNLLRQLVYASIFGASLVCAQAVMRPAVLLALPVAVMLTLGWFCLSISWSANPGIATRRLALTLLVIWSVFLLVGTIGYSGVIRIARSLLPLVLCANFLAVILAPGWGIHQAAIDGDPSIVGAWRGILMQKNFAGVACALTILFFAFDASHITAAWRWIVMLAAAFFLYHTNSRTSMLLLLSSLSIGAMARYYLPYYRWIWCILFACLTPLAAVLLYDYRDNWTAIFADPDAFTGRVQIWRVLVRYASDHLLLGSGYGSFWNAGEPQPLAQYTHGWVLTKIVSGHNGFLDILVQTGLPGLILAVFSGLLAPLWLFMHQKNMPVKQASMALALIWFCFTQNLTESGLYDRDATSQVFLMLGIALLYRGVRPR